MKIQFASQPDTATRLQARLVDKDKLPADLEPVVRAGAAAARFTGKAGQVFEAFVERDGAVVVRRYGQPVPGCHLIRNGLDSVWNRVMQGSCELKVRVRGFKRLEACHTGYDPAVYFRQNDVHGQIRRRKTALGILPILLAAGGQCYLENGTLRRIQRRGPRRILPGKSSGIDNNRRRRLHECCP